MLSYEVSSTVQFILRIFETFLGLCTSYHNYPTLNTNFNEPIIAKDSDDLDEDDELEMSDECPMFRLIEHDDKGIVPNQDEVEIINLGSEDDTQEVMIGTPMT